MILTNSKVGFDVKMCKDKNEGTHFGLEVVEYGFEMCTKG